MELLIKNILKSSLAYNWKTFLRHHTSSEERELSHSKKAAFITIYNQWIKLLRLKSIQE